MPAISPRLTRRGFSLLELLVVLAILVIVMSIVIPTLSGFRNAARKSATQQMMASLSTSIGTYNLDQRRLPGYFSPREMGNTTNTDFSTMENLVLDLAGGATTATGTGILRDVGPGGPTGTGLVNVDPSLIGAAQQTSTGSVSKTYFTPDPKFFIKQNGSIAARQPQQRATNGRAQEMPVLVDAWGSPILAWSQDAQPTETTFAEMSTPRQGGTAFYAQSNSAFLNSASLGKLAISQGDVTVGSLLNGTGTRVTDTMTALLGNPSFSFPNINPAKPSAVRAPIVMHSAGQDGVYLGKSERGGKAVPPGTGLQYKANLDPIEGGAFNDFLVTAQ